MVWEICYVIANPKGLIAHNLMASLRTISSRTLRNN